MATRWPARLGLLWLSSLGACVLIVDPDSVSEGCPDGQKPCFGQCVSTQLPDFGCGGEQCSPCALDNALTICDGQARCKLIDCRPGFGNCDGGDANGCETDTAHTAAHCGACDTPCEAPPQGIPGCAGGSCTLGGCLEGWGDCDLDAANGCEEDVTRSSSHCGACRRPCGADQACIAGRCG